MKQITLERKKPYPLIGWERIEMTLEKNQDPQVFPGSISTNIPEKAFFFQRNQGWLSLGCNRLWPIVITLSTNILVFVSWKTVSIHFGSCLILPLLFKLAMEHSSLPIISMTINLIGCAQCFGQSRPLSSAQHNTITISVRCYILKLQQNRSSMNITVWVCNTLLIL